MKTTIGIDNGSTGSIGIIGPDYQSFTVMPTKKSLLGKAGKIVKRVDVNALMELLMPHATAPGVYSYVERPFTGRFLNAVLPAQRAFEAVLIALELSGIGYTVIDSKEWQLAVLGKIKGSALLKEASKLRATQMYPAFTIDITRHGDADGLLMAHHYHHK